MLCIPVSSQVSASSDQGWEFTTPLPKQLYMSGSSVINNKIYIVGGSSSGQASDINKDLLLYDPVSKMWDTKAPMITPRSDISTAQVNGKLYAIGGFDSTGKYTKKIEEYDPSTNTWSSKADMLSTARQGFSTAVINNKIYIIGGQVNYGTITYNVEQYDPVTNQWSIVKTDFPRVERGMAISFNNKIYILGGSEPGISNSQRVLEYDPSSGSVVRKSNMPTGRYLGSASLNNGKILVVGGKTDTSKGNIVEIYDPALDTWTTGPSIAISRVFHTAESLLNKTFIMGGYSDEEKKIVNLVEVTDLSASIPNPDPETIPEPNQPNGNRALLTIILSTGMIKEFDLSMNEVNTYLDWYDTANGSTRFGFDKHNNNKGPFSKRTDYVVHDKILTFEVNEYKVIE